MRKNINDLAVGDWVVLDAMVWSRFCGKPWKVTKLSGQRVYLVCYWFDKVEQTLEIEEEKYVNRKSLIAAFGNEEDAKAVSAKASELSLRYERELGALNKEHQARVAEYLASI